MYRSYILNTFFHLIYTDVYNRTCPDAGVSYTCNIIPLLTPLMFKRNLLEQIVLKGTYSSNEIQPYSKQKHTV